MKNDTKSKAASHNCGCSPQNTNMHKLMKMGYEPKMTKPSPKTPA
jgi:hypothetical protein